MKLQRAFRVGTAASFIGFASVTAFPGFTSVGDTQTLPTPSANVSVFATGFNNPRGLTFGPDGNLYVAEGGIGGTNSTVGICTQVPAPIGPYTGSPTGGRISKVTSAGVRSTVTDALPSDQTAATQGSLVSGVASIAFVGNSMYALEAGAGCSHGVSSAPNGVYKVDTLYGTASLIANLGSFESANPTKTIEPDDFEPDGTWYSMINVNGTLYAVDPNHGEIDMINPATGVVTRLADISATQGHIVPTSVAYNAGSFFVGNLGTFPITPGSEKILQITPSGSVTVAATGLTTVVGVAFDRFGQMYALETATNAGLPGPTNLGTGMIVKVSSTGSPQTIASGLTFPTGMTFGPDGNIYVSQTGFGLPSGAGQVLKVTVPQGIPLSASVAGSAGRGAGNRYTAIAN
jgi:hypothetical protein